MSKGMKNKYIIAVLLASLVVLSGCGGKKTSRDGRSGLSVYTDSETGCEYVFKAAGYAGGMTARMLLMMQNRMVIWMSSQKQAIA